MKIFAKLILITLIALPAAAQVVYEGTGVVSRYGELPSAGSYAASDSFLPNTPVLVTNLQNGKQTRVIVTARADDPSVFMLLSTQAASELGINTGDVARLKAQPAQDQDLVIQPEADEQAYSRDPEVNPTRNLTAEDLSFLQKYLSEPQEETDLAQQGDQELETSEPAEELPESLALEEDQRETGDDTQTAVTEETEEPDETVVQEEPEVTEEPQETVEEDIPGPESLTQTTPEEAAPDMPEPADPQLPPEPEPDQVTDPGVNTEVATSEQPDEPGEPESEEFSPEVATPQTGDEEEGPRYVYTDGSHGAGTDLQAPPAEDFPALPQESSPGVLALDNPAPADDQQRLSARDVPQTEDRTDTDELLGVLAMDAEGPGEGESPADPAALPEERVPGDSEGPTAIAMENDEPDTSEELMAAGDLPEERIPGDTEGPNAIAMENDDPDSREEPLAAGDLPAEKIPGQTEAPTAIAGYNEPEDQPPVDVTLSETPVEPEEDTLYASVPYAGGDTPFEESPRLAVSETPSVPEGTPTGPVTDIVRIDPEGEPEAEPEIADEPEERGRTEPLAQVDDAEAEEVPEERLSLGDVDIQLKEAEMRPPEGPVEIASAEESAGPPEGTEPSGEKALANIPGAGEVPVIEALVRNNHYLQIAAYQNLADARTAVSHVPAGYPVALYTGGNHTYRLVIGPLTPDESGIVLYQFKARGYRDAFVRKGQ